MKTFNDCKNDEERKSLGEECYPDNLPERIQKDLRKVNFSFENFSDFGEGGGLANYPSGYDELKNGFHIFYASAGGDWEYPVCFIFYWSEEETLRAYVPKHGNVWNKKEKCAYGSEEEVDPHQDDKDRDEKRDKEFNLDLMNKDILKRVHKK